MARAARWTSTRTYACAWSVRLSNTGMKINMQQMIIKILKNILAKERKVEMKCRRRNVFIKDATWREGAQGRKHEHSRIEQIYVFINMFYLGWITPHSMMCSFKYSSCSVKTVSWASGTQNPTWSTRPRKTTKVCYYFHYYHIYSYFG